MGYFLVWWYSKDRIDLFREESLFYFISCGGISFSSLLCMSNTIDSIVSPNLDRLNPFFTFLYSLTGLKDFLVIFRAMTQPLFLIDKLRKLFIG